MNGCLCSVCVCENEARKTIQTHILSRRFTDRSFEQKQLENPLQKTHHTWKRYTNKWIMRHTRGSMLTNQRNSEPARRPRPMLQVLVQLGCLHKWCWGCRAFWRPPWRQRALSSGPLCYPKCTPECRVGCRLELVAPGHAPAVHRLCLAALTKTQFSINRTSKTVWELHHSQRNVSLLQQAQSN